MPPKISGMVSDLTVKVDDRETPPCSPNSLLAQGLFIEMVHFSPPCLLPMENAWPTSPKRW
jgi:hypothetical protein